jgi:hypothetical protein
MTDQPTDQPDQPPIDDNTLTEPIQPTAAEPTSVAAPPAATAVEPRPSRWNRVRPRGRLGQVAAILVAAAAAVFIVGSIFMAGFAVGSEGGGGHHRHGGNESSHSEGEGKKGSSHDGSGRDDPRQGGSNDDDGPGHG